MSKRSFKPGTMLNPVPAVLVSLGSTPETQNLITIAWTGIINSNPPLTYISVRKSRHSHSILIEEQEFVINLVTADICRQTDFCGVRSGAKVDKQQETGLTLIPSELVKCPAVKESPVNLECRVQEVKSYPSHDMFIAEIVNVRVDEKLISEQGRIELERAGLVAYSHGEYFPLAQKPLGGFGYSVMKQKTRKRKAREEAQQRQSRRSTKPKEVKSGGAKAKGKTSAKPRA